MRYTTSGIWHRLQLKGFIYSEDLTWVEGQRRRLQNLVPSPGVLEELDLIAKIEALAFRPCPGEAHSNAYIDNCYTCMPRWGQIPNPGVVK